MAYLLALASAALYGGADFLGGMASRRTNAVAIVVMSQAAGILMLALILPLLPAASPSTADHLWGGAAGFAGGIGVGLLYRALAVGTMAVVAPTTAVCAVIIPVLAGAAFLGERLALQTMLGIGLAIVAIVLVSQQPVAPPLSGSRGGPGRARPAGMGLALASGVAIGLFFLALARTRAEAGMWPLLAARAVSVSLFGVIAAMTGRPLRMPAPVAKIAVAAGVIDMLANALYLAATRFGALSVIVTLSSLYPASTVLLARVVLGERLSALQAAGIVCAAVAVILIVSSG